MRTADIKKRFLDHFEQRGHTVVPSASLVSDDPTLLFTVAGMVPFIPYLTGQQTPPYLRATSVQKCVRTLDIEEVGRTTRHGTFFQMNGNFSFGDYFKQGAIEFAWELITKPQEHGGFGIDPATIWATVYKDDDEAFRLWQEVTGLPTERIQRRGLLDNYWHTGVPGPGGPSSEIYVDRGAEYGPDGGPVVDEDRFLEIWNLVFMQEELSAVRKKDDFDVSRPLPAKNIDTGMGMERVAYLLQGKENLYEIDEVFPVLQRAAELTGRAYGANRDDDVRLRVIADHVRSGLMLIGDGVRPGNEGRGYVLRRLLRRAVLSMRQLGYQEPALSDLLPVSRDCMSPSYPELATDFERISSYAYAEEEAFRRTLVAGTTILDTAVRSAKSSGAASLSGEQAFALHDTYGFPIDLTFEIAQEAGLDVDQSGFTRLMKEQRDRAKADAAGRRSGQADVSAYRAVLDGQGPSAFTGYVEVTREARVVGLFVDGAQVSAAGAGTDVEIVLDATPFYAEAGGQLADQGLITVDGGSVTVHDVQAPMPGLVVHRGRVDSGELQVSSAVFAAVDIGRRLSISRAHTATHLIHTAIRRALGESATQAGSLNAPGRLRFDFATPSAVPPSVLSDVEEEVNSVLADDLEVRAFLTSQEHARAIGAMALFGEKYGEEVRVVEVGDYARELCGGTHTGRSAQIGLVKLLSESSIGVGVRRLDALVGLDAFRYLAREHVLVGQLTELFRVPAEEVPERVRQTVERLRVADKELERLRGAGARAGAASLAEQARDVSGVAFVAAAPPGLAAGDLRALAQDVRGRLAEDRPAAVLLASTSEGKVALVSATNARARERGVSAADLLVTAAAAVGGRGGGREDIAQGGGIDPAGIPEAFARAEVVIAAADPGS
ncbi:MAG: alanine--tRNA ligase [Geodermatophilaceae bacterium]|nr:alanine--tRNA ligase [Geodermatophilaceae bacterium]